MNKKLGQKKDLNEKRKVLKETKQQNQMYINQIRELNSAIWNLKWTIPEVGVKQDIQQLKQSIRIPITSSVQPPQTLQQTLKTLQQSIKKSQQPKQINNLQHRKQTLQKLQKLNKESSLYQSHRRIILKEYLQKIREQNTKQKEKNDILQSQLINIDIDIMIKQYKQLTKQLEKCSRKLDVSRLL